MQFLHKKSLLSLVFQKYKKMKIFSVLALQGAQACLNLYKCDNGSSGNAVDTSGSSGSDGS